MTKRRPLTTREKTAQQNLRAIWDTKKKKHGLTQEKAAHMLGWSSQGTVGQYLLGRVSLNTDALLKFAELLQVSPREIDPKFRYTVSQTYETVKSQSASVMVAQTIRENPVTYSSGQQTTASEQAAVTDIPRHVRDLVDTIFRKAHEGFLTKEHTEVLKKNVELMTKQK